MNKDFLKGLFFFAAGFLTARYLMKKAEIANPTTTVPNASSQQMGIAANIEGIVTNVKTWLKDNFSELSDTEAEGYAKEATGTTDVAGGQTGATAVAVDAAIFQNAQPIEEQKWVHQPISSGYGDLGYQQNANIFDNNIVRSLPDAYDIRQAIGEQRNMDAMQDHFTWSFN